jgi:hypothetical protein
MWELYYAVLNTTGSIVEIARSNDGKEVQPLDSVMIGDTYNYYGRPIHKSRVMRLEGKQAPSLIRPRLRGWGMSEVERIVRSLTSILKIKI